MTLLELLLALTIMASVMGLLGALMAQAHGWTERSIEDEGLMRLQRVGEALRTQWADRRTSVDLGRDGEKVVTTSTELRFVTATDLLFPEWPLVVATYRIEPDLAHVSSSGLLWRLVYEETRVAAMDEPPAEYALDAQGRSMRDSTVLLEGCAELRWERFGRKDDQTTRRDRADSSRDGEAAEGDGSGTSGSSGRDGRRTAPADRAPSTPQQDEEESRAASKEDLQFKWRPLEERFEGFVSAVRLVGAQNGERFGWVFVIRALR